MDPDSSSAPLREGYDDKVLCTDEADILSRTRDLISETLDKHDSQNCDSNEGNVHHTPCVHEGDGKIAMEEGKREISLLLVTHMTSRPLATKSLIKCLLMKKLSAFSKKLGL